MPASSGPTAAAAGLLLGLSLIVAIGPQNAFVIRQGVVREHVRTIVVLCSVSDAVLMIVGAGGGSALLAGRHLPLTIASVGGAAFLFGYAALAARRALRPRPAGGLAGAALSRRAAITTCLAVSWLNPWADLDTVVLLGSVANSHPGRQWWFVSGAIVASLVWFCTLGFAAGLLAPVLRRPRSWRVLDAFVAMAMLTTGIRLLTSL